MRLFDAARRGFKGSRAPDAMFPSNQGWTSWLNGPNTNVDYRTQLGDPMDNSIVAILFGWKSRNWRQAKPVIYETVDGDEPKIITDHILLDLIKNPNPFYSGSLFWEAMLQDKIFDGTALAQIITDKYGIPSALYWLPTESMVPIYDADGTEWIRYWECTVAGVSRKLAPDEVFVWQEGKDRQYAGRKGYSRFKAGIAEAVTDNEARNTINAFLRNRAEIGTYISPDPQMMAALLRAGKDPMLACMTPEQARETESKINAKNTGDGKFALNVFPRPVSIAQQTTGIKDLDFKLTRQMTESRLAALLGIHPVVAGFSVGLDASSDKNNMITAQEMSWKNGIIPDQDSLAEVLNERILPLMDLEAGKRLFDYDRKDVEALQEDADEKSTRILSQWEDDAITHDEMRTQLGFPVDESRKGKYYSDLITAGANPATDPAVVAAGKALRDRVGSKWRDRVASNGVH